LGLSKLQATFATKKEMPRPPRCRFFIAMLLPMLFSCHNNGHTAVGLQPDSTVAVNYGKGFAIDCSKDYKRVTVYDPWEKRGAQPVCYLVGKPGVTTPDKSHRVVVPLLRLATMLLWSRWESGIEPVLRCCCSYFKSRYSGIVQQRMDGIVAAWMGRMDKICAGIL
jgi:hypothetical protein